MIVRRALVVVAAATVAACVPRAPKPLAPVPESLVFKMPARDVCATSTGGFAAVGTLDDPDLVETSGVVASPSNPGVLWMHNDSGDEARLFATSTTGVALGRLALPGVDADDFEDIAAGPCPDFAGPCIYVGDTGDNDEDRDQLVVYAVPEPKVSVETPLPEGARAESVWRFPIQIPDAPANIEGFVVLPDLSAMVFYEKRASDARVLRYRAPWTADNVATVEVTAVFDPPGQDLGGLRLITSADVHPTGTRLLLRTYLGVFEAELDGNEATADHPERARFVQLDSPPDEEQGEAIAYDDDGTGIWSVSESREKLPHVPLHHASCQ